LSLVVVDAAIAREAAKQKKEEKKKKKKKKNPLARLAEPWPDAECDARGPAPTDRMPLSSLKGANHVDE
jgi:hypothetical protein